MKRVIFGTISIVLILELVLIVPFLFFTSTGKQVMAAFSPPPVPKPILTVRGAPPTMSAAAVYLLDADTGHTLLDTHGELRLPMASTTKMMTALVVLNKGNLNKMVTVNEDAVKEALNKSTANLRVGEQIRMQDLLYALILPSGNDAAIAIADGMSGSVPAFVQQMNDYAHQLNLKNTHYINPNGLTYLLPNGQPDPHHYTTAS